jgi:endonuclease-3
MRIEQRYREVLAWFQSTNPAAATELTFHDPYELTVAVILSAQCTDKRVNILTPPFCRKFPDFNALSVADPKEVFELIRSCSYPNNKTKNLIAMAIAVRDRFGGKLPAGVDELETIPGIGRKTANVLASVLFDAPVIAVDTHVFRVADRIGLTTGAKIPLQTEEQLTRHIPAHLRAVAHHWLILHGRYICQARKPRCGECGLKTLCRYYLTAQGT